MRIIRGKYKGKKIRPPKNFKARPTTDYAKESLFNILENRIDIGSIRVLDLFSGTGSISFEFLSRGCVDLTAVEKNKRYAAHIKEQFNELFQGNTKVTTADAFGYCKHADLNYDVIFADPPFHEKRIPDLPGIITDNESLPETAVIIIEHPAEINFTDHEYFTETRKYGNVHFSFFSVAKNKKK